MELLAAVRIREATREDAEALVKLFEALYGQTNYMLMEPGESTQSAESLAQRIEAGAHGNSEVWFVCDSANQLVGVLYGRRGVARRNRHSLYLVMGVLHASWGKGIGAYLLRTMEQWALEHRIHRLELSVNSLNDRAISLYERAGFEREGVKRHSLCLNGQYVDELYMSKLIAP